VSVLSTAQQAQDEEQDHGARKGNYDTGDVDAIHRIGHVEEGGGEEAAHDGADDDIPNQPEAAAHHLSSQPTCDQPYNEPCQDTHKYSPYLELSDT
jgi:hypothetical protein